MRTTTFRFEEIPCSKKIKPKCKECGDVVTRTITHTLTVNPFNKNPDGTVCSPSEVFEQACEYVEQDVRKAMSDGVVCSGRCKHKRKASA